MPEVLTQTQHDLTFSVHDEKQLTWQQHNRIHDALNRAYDDRTQSFTKKTFAESEPSKRIICSVDKKIVGHIAIFESSTTLDDKTIPIAGIGLKLALIPHINIGNSLSKRAIALCAELNYPFAVGRITNSETVKTSLMPITSCFLDIPMRGHHSQSHEWETLAFYDTQIKPTLTEEAVNYFREQGCMVINGEIF
tara:strand:+ start:3545 stop:4126 length:582 start_codon:yes stop_codon:yes gene_type:complete